MNNDEYYEPEIIESPNCVVRVYRPKLTEEEHKKRMKAIHDAAADLLRDIYNRKSSDSKESLE